MKRIVKNPEPPTFVEWKEEWRRNGIEPGWGEFDGKPIKQTVKTALLEEQGYLCCFCECRVGLGDGSIAHFRAQSEDRESSLEYGNLLYSCEEKPKKDKIPQTCNQAQDKEMPPISPLDEDCETHFAYDPDGNILGKTDKARETIRILNLNGSKQLCESRRAVYEETQTMLLSNKWSKEKLERQSDGTFRPFWTTMKYAAGLYS